MRVSLGVCMCGCVLVAPASSSPGDWALWDCGTEAPPVHHGTVCRYEPPSRPSIEEFEAQYPDIHLDEKGIPIPEVN